MASKKPQQRKREETERLRGEEKDGEFDKGGEERQCQWEDAYI